MSVLSKRLSKIESELLVAVQPNRFIHIQRCGYNKDSDIIGYKSWLDSVSVMRLENEPIEALHKRARLFFIANNTRGTSNYILRCIYEITPID